MKHFLGATLVALALWSFPARAETIYFSPVPQQSASVTAQRWSGLIAALQETTGLDIAMRVAPDIPTFEACLARGAFHLAYMNPYHFTVFSGRAGYRALAHRDGPGLRGILVARNDSDFTDLASVSGQRLAFPSPAAFGASVLIRGELLARGIAFSPVYVKSHASVYLAVNARAMYAGGGVERTLRVAPDAARPNLRIVHKTDEYTPHAFAALADLDVEARKTVQQALVALAATRPEVLEPLGLKGWRIPDADAYQDVRRLNIAEAHAGMTDLETRVCPFG